MPAYVEEDGVSPERQTSRPAPGVSATPAGSPHILELGLQPDRVTLRVNVNGGGDRLELEEIALDHKLPEQHLSAYARFDARRVEWGCVAVHSRR